MEAKQSMRGKHIDGRARETEVAADAIEYGPFAHLKAGELVGIEGAARPQAARIRGTERRRRRRRKR